MPKKCCKQILADNGVFVCPYVCEDKNTEGCPIIDHRTQGQTIDEFVEDSFCKGNLCNEKRKWECDIDHCNTTINIPLLKEQIQKYIKSQLLMYFTVDDIKRNEDFWGDDIRDFIYSLGIDMEEDKKC